MLRAEPPMVRPEYERLLPPLPPTARRARSAAALAARRACGSRRLAAQGLILLPCWPRCGSWAGALADNDLLLPSFLQTARAFSRASRQRRAAALRAACRWRAAAGLWPACRRLRADGAGVSSRIGRDLLETLTAMFNPLPAIALLPLALLWFGLGKGSLVFVLVHSVLWPLALNTYAGFQRVPETLRMAGRNYGLGGLRMVLQILVPAALPAILSGLKIGWAFAWRTLIAAELVFGATSGKGGLGWYIFQNRNELFTDKVFAGLALVI
jgi:NitT/TauT family transport system permease protein